MRTISLRRFGQYLEISPPCPELRRALQTSVHELRQQGNTAVIGQTAANLYQETSDQGMAVVNCFAGLQPVVQEVVTMSGYKVQNCFKASPRLPSANLAQIQELGPCDTAFLEVVQSEERALIRYIPGAVDVAWLISELALAWPALTIAVVVSRIAEARGLRGQLLRYLPNVVAVTSRDRVSDEQVGRIVVATNYGLAHTGVEIEKRHIIVALNAIEASSREALYCLGFAKNARMYGLLAQGTALTPHEQDTVRQLFGFHEAIVRPHGYQERQVEVVRSRNAGGIRLAEEIDLIDLKRRGLWHNELRNRRIARLAQLLKAADRAGIQQRFPAVAGALNEASPPIVLVLVENVEHGEILARRLPGWPLLAARDVWLNGLTVVLGSLPAQHAIATSVGLPPVDVAQWDIVIRADGGTGLPPFIQSEPVGSILYTVNNLSPRMLLVDFDDRNHPILRRWSRQRWAAYAEHGWYPPGINAVQVRIDRFLASRPKEVE